MKMLILTMSYGVVVSTVLFTKLDTCTMQTTRSPNRSIVTTPSNSCLYGSRVIAFGQDVPNCNLRADESKQNYMLPLMMVWLPPFHTTDNVSMDLVRTCLSSY